MSGFIANLLVFFAFFAGGCVITFAAVTFKIWRMMKEDD